jgi:hypothetical protein
MARPAHARARKIQFNVYEMDEAARSPRKLSFRLDRAFFFSIAHCRLNARTSRTEFSKAKHAPNEKTPTSDQRKWGHGNRSSGSLNANEGSKFNECESQYQ